MDKKIIIGLGGLAVAGAIAGGVYFSQNNPFNIDPPKEDPKSNNEKIEKLYFEELENKDRYTFCLGKETISGVYENFIFGNEKGLVDYTSSDVSVFDKKSNKLYILGRNIDYKYSGNADLSHGIGEGKMEINEKGKFTEYYKKNSAPIRIDYNSKIIYPAPERKSKEWVNIIIKSIGSVMGFSDDRIDEEKGDAKVFCSYFNFGGNILENGTTVTPDSFSFEGTCPDNSPSSGVSFSGDFEFNCSNIDSKQGIELLKNYKEREEIENTPLDIDMSIFQPEEEGNEFKKILETGESDSNPEDIRNKLEEFKNEMKADAKAQ